ncbi:MAG: NTP transferase domain-containing protein, partial [Deltaproteobacteria bacterium]|nr:NTP transferase domain-containing protein [Deltaproteobacteria bacterium]
MPDIKKGKKIEPVAGLVLAAGASTRMGTPKQLLPVGTDLLLERVLEQSLHSNLDLVVLVLGFMAKEIRAKIRFGRRS